MVWTFLSVSLAQGLYYRRTKAVFFPNVMLPVTQFDVVFDFEGGEA